MSRIIVHHGTGISSITQCKVKGTAWPEICCPQWSGVIRDQKANMLVDDALIHLESCRYSRYMWNSSVIPLVFSCFLPGFLEGFVTIHIRIVFSQAEVGGVFWVVPRVLLAFWTGPWLSDIGPIHSSVSTVVQVVPYMHHHAFGAACRLAWW